MFVLAEGTMMVETPRIRIASAPQLINVPANREASFLIALENESETGDDSWFEIIVDEATNPHGAELKIDGGFIGNGRMFLVRAGETLNKTVTVGIGPSEYDYRDIGIIIRSLCQNDPTSYFGAVADTAWLSVEFVPPVTNVAITQPRQNWIMNAENATGALMEINISDFDVNFPNFGYIQLEYRAAASPVWNTIVTFYPAHLYDNAQGVKENIGANANIVYHWDTSFIPDGAYELRATAASVNIDGSNNIIGQLSTFVTEAVEGYKDLTRPTSLGAPSPSNGILGAGTELSITFNEDIQTGMLTQNNFSISGVLNAQQIAEPSVGIALSGTNYAQTELPIFTSGSFSVETWFKRQPNTAGALFSYGGLSLGFNAEGNAVVTIADETLTSVEAIANDETWKYVAMSYDRDANTVSVFAADGDASRVMLADRQLTAEPQTQGRLTAGANAELNNGFTGAMSQLHFYGVKRSQADVAATQSLTKSGSEPGLTGIASPVIFDVLDEEVQTIALRRGWNWISTNVTNDAPSIFTQMKSSLGTAGELIKDRDAFVQQPGWLGSLTAITETSMYLVNVNADQSMMLSGKSADPATTSLTIGSQWNWIGYLPPFTLTLDHALAGTNPQAGDQIKGQTDFAVWTGASWIGSLRYMEPGKGYMYYSTTATQRTFNYPSDISLAVTGSISRSSTQQHWNVANVSQYPGNMTMVAVVENAGEEVKSDQIEIAAFSGQQVRGATMLKFEPTLNRYIGYLTIHGEGAESITLRVYDHANDAEHTPTNAPIAYATDARHGTPAAPYRITFGTDNGNGGGLLSNTPELTAPEAQVTIYPNPVNDRLYIDRPWETIDIVEIYDAGGRLVLKQSAFNEAAIEVSTLPAGVYFLNMKRGEDVVVKRFVKE